MKLSKGAVVAGGSSLAYKTGSWRNQKPVINYEKCKECGICEMVCPDNAVSLVGEKYVIDYDYCKGCGLCAYECTAGAISMVFEAK